MKSNQNRNIRKVISWEKTFKKIGDEIDRIQREYPELNITTCHALIKALYSTYIKEYASIDSRGLRKASNERIRHAHVYFCKQIKRSPRTIFRQIARILETEFLLAKEPTQKPAKDKEGKDYTLCCTLFVLNDDFIHYQQNGDIWNVDNSKKIDQLSTIKHLPHVDNEYSLKSHVEKMALKPK